METVDTASPQLICLPTATLRQETNTQTRARIGILHWFPGQITRCLMPQERRNPLLSTQRESREDCLHDYSKKLLQSQRMGTSVPRLYFGCNSGHSLGEWGRQLESRCLEEALASRLRREPLATASGDREPRPGREQGGPEAWALWGFSIN